MELRVLQYFLAVAREQSIIRAAESLHLSQPTLSTQIRNMEKELGRQLLIRGTKGSRKVTLTEEGMILKNRARRQKMRSFFPTVLSSEMYTSALQKQIVFISWLKPQKNCRTIIRVFIIIFPVATTTL